MAARYWVGGTASWDATAGTKWATTDGGAGGAAVPTSADDVYFTAASGAVTVTFSGSGGRPALTVDFTGFTGTFTATSSDRLLISGTLLKFSSGMTLTWPGNSAVTSTVAWQNTNIQFLNAVTCNLTTAGKTLPGLLVGANAAGTLSLQDALTCSTVIYHFNGTFTTNNFNVTVQQYWSNDSTNARTINLGSSTVTLTLAYTSNTNAAWTMNGTNLTVNAGTSTIVLTGTTSASINSAKYFAGGGKTYYNVVFNPSTASTAARLYGANTYNNITINGPTTAGTIAFNLSNGGPTITGTFTVAGSNGNQRVFISGGGGNTITAAAVSLTDVDFFNCSVAGAATWNGTRLGDFGLNSGSSIGFATPKTVYWNLAAGGNFKNNAFTTSSGGTPATTNFPLPQDTLIIDDTGLTTGNTITITTAEAGAGEDATSSYYVPALTVTRSNAFTLAFAGTPYVAGDMTLTSATTVTGSLAAIYLFNCRGNTFGDITLTTNGVTLSLSALYPYYCRYLKLGSALTIDGILYPQAYGAIDTNNYNITCKVIGFATSAQGFTNKLGSSTITITTGQGGASNLFLAADTSVGLLDAGTSTIILSDTTNVAVRSFVGGGQTYNNVVFGAGAGTGTYAITGSNTFNSLSTNKSVAYGITMTGGTTQTFNSFTAKGASGALLTLASTNATPATLTKGAGTVGIIDYASVSYITGSPTSTWYAVNSTDSGNNTNITFSAPPTKGNFFDIFYT